MRDVVGSSLQVNSGRLVTLVPGVGDLHGNVIPMVVLLLVLILDFCTDFVSVGLYYYLNDLDK